MGQDFLDIYNTETLYYGRRCLHACKFFVLYGWTSGTYSGFLKEGREIMKHKKNICGYP